MERQLAPKAVAGFAGPASQFQSPVQDKTGSDRNGLRCRNIQVAERLLPRENVEMSLLMQSPLSRTRRGLKRAASSINLQTIAPHGA